MKIACVSISRSDWNALGMVAMALGRQQVPLNVIAAPDHEAPEMLHADGFAISSMTAIDDADLVVLCGDRYKTLLLACELAHRNIPIAHLAGGDITEGSTDDSYRHAITKLAHLHFPTHKDAAKRILQMGEEPWRVFNHGSASIDRIRATPLLSRAETMAAVGLPEAASNVILLNWQPDTGKAGEFGSALWALKQSGADIVAVGANDDPRGSGINYTLACLASTNPKLHFVASLPSRVYLSLMRWCNAMVGNSSSAYYEAPALGCLAIDVGDRQAGRPRGPNICPSPGNGSIEAHLRGAFTVPVPRKPYPSPYGDGQSAPRIAETILSFSGQRDRLLRKKFAVAA